MSVHVSSRVWKTEVGDFGAKLVLLKLADNANDHGEAFPGRRRLATECEMSERTVDRKLELLERKGLIEKAAHHDPTGRQTSNRYKLVGVVLSDRSSDGYRGVVADAPGGDNVTPLLGDNLTGEGDNLTPSLSDAELEDVIAPLSLKGPQRARWFVPAERRRVTAWVLAWLNPPTNVKNPNGWVISGVDGHDWPPRQKPQKKPVVCPECDLGGGEHLADCPSVIGLAA